MVRSVFPDERHFSTHLTGSQPLRLAISVGNGNYNQFLNINKNILRRRLFFSEPINYV